MKKSKYFCFTLTILLIIFFSGCTNKNQQEYIEEFAGYAECFQSINAVVLSAIESDETYINGLDEYGKKTYIVEREDNEITGLYKFPQELSSQEISMLGLINEFMKDDFEAVVCFESRISYEGDGSRMIVYSPDEKPAFFFYPGDGLDFHTYELQNNWYLLIHPMR